MTLRLDVNQIIKVLHKTGVISTQFIWTAVSKTRA